MHTVRTVTRADDGGGNFSEIEKDADAVNFCLFFHPQAWFY